jgi:hypothetical protein
MDVHGVNANEALQRSNMQQLYDLVQSADKIINY